MANTQPKSSSYDLLVKLLLIGDSGVGKSCLLQRFSDDAFSTTFITTIGIDFKIRTVDIDGKRIKLQIWDTAGQERFRTITTAYYRSAMGILLVFDITDDRSFNNITAWLKNIDAHACNGVNRMLVGNKCDFSEKRQISIEQAREFGKEYNLEYIETSAKMNINVEKAFLTLAKDVVVRLSSSQSDPNKGDGGPTKVDLSSGGGNNQGSKISKCCG